MKPFHTIAIPHRDILEGKLTMDVFAADLWAVSKNEGIEEYKNPDVFFKKTYLTEGLKNLIDAVEKRIKGEFGDPVIQLQTPFGGGKSHSLIALYHKAKEWNVKRVVICGTDLEPRSTIWGEIERQLKGKCTKFNEMVAPGKENIINFLEENKPLLILMDEILEYVTKSAGVKVGESFLSAQTMVFLKALIEAVSSIDKVCLLITLPSSKIEHYDEQAEKLFLQLQKISGRQDKIYTPVQDFEIPNVIRQRLFSQIDEKDMKKVVNSFVKYAEKENLLPIGIEESQYRDKFYESYPFMPEVINILYHRWGSFPTFQRTRGVLRLLALVIYSLKNSNISYISPADFDLGNQQIRQEFIKYIGNEFNTVIASDITSLESGAKKVDDSLGSSYKKLKLGTRTATTIFLYSFSGGTEKGATLSEIKRCSTLDGYPASVVAEAADQLKGKLYYLQSSGDKYFFSNQPNLNRIRLNKMENIKDEQVENAEREIIEKSLSGDKFKVYLWEEEPSNIPDDEEMKLIILKRKNIDIMKNILDKKGQTPRVNKNNLFFLYPLEGEKAAFVEALKLKLACEAIEVDKTLNLTEEQKKENKKELKNAESSIYDRICRIYRLISIPSKDGFKEMDLGVPTYGERKNLHEGVYDKLKTDSEINEGLAPLVIKEKYLKDKEYVLTEQLFQAFYRTPGELRPASKEIFIECIKSGVKQGLFGLGELKDEKPICYFFKEITLPAIFGNEIIISESLCKKEKEGYETIKPKPDIASQGEIEIFKTEGKIEKPLASGKSKIKLKFEIPKGKVSDTLRMLHFIQNSFNKIEITIEAEEGNISIQDYQNKIIEALAQLNIKYEEIYE